MISNATIRRPQFEPQRQVWQEIVQRSPLVAVYWAHWNQLEFKEGITKKLIKIPDGTEDRA